MDLFIFVKNKKKHVNVLRSHVNKQNTLNLKIAWKLENEINKIIQNVKLLKKMIYTIKCKMGIKTLDENPICHQNISTSFGERLCKSLKSRWETPNFYTP